LETLSLNLLLIFLSNAKPPFVNYYGDQASEADGGSRSHPDVVDNTTSQPVTNSAEIADKQRGREPPAYADVATVALSSGDLDIDATKIAGAV
jgi:hypothetical protein